MMLVLNSRLVWLIGLFLAIISLALAGPVDSEQIDLTILIARGKSTSSGKSTAAAPSKPNVASPPKEPPKAATTPAKDTASKSRSSTPPPAKAPSAPQQNIVPPKQPATKAPDKVQSPPPKKQNNSQNNAAPPKQSVSKAAPENPVSKNQQKPQNNAATSKQQASKQPSNGAGQNRNTSPKIPNVSQKNTEPPKLPGAKTPPKNSNQIKSTASRPRNQQQSNLAPGKPVAGQLSRPANQNTRPAQKAQTRPQRNTASQSTPKKTSGQNQNSARKSQSKPQRNTAPKQSGRQQPSKAPSTTKNPKPNSRGASGAQTAKTKSKPSSSQRRPEAQKSSKSLSDDKRSKQAPDQGRTKTPTSRTSQQKAPNPKAKQALGSHAVQKTPQNSTPQRTEKSTTKQAGKDPRKKPIAPTPKQKPNNADRHTTGSSPNDTAKNKDTPARQQKVTEPEKTKQTPDQKKAQGTKQNKSTSDTSAVKSKDGNTNAGSKPAPKPADSVVKPKDGNSSAASKPASKPADSAPKASTAPPTTPKPAADKTDGPACKIRRRHARMWKRITAADCEEYDPAKINAVTNQNGQPDVAAADPTRTGGSLALKYTDRDHRGAPGFVPGPNGPVPNPALVDQLGGYAVKQNDEYAKNPNAKHSGALGFGIEQNGFGNGVHRIDVATTRLTNGPGHGTQPNIPANVMGQNSAGQTPGRGVIDPAPHVEETIGWQKSLEGKQRPHENTHYGTYSTPGTPGSVPEKIGACGSNCGPMLNRGGGTDLWPGARTQANIDSSNRRQAAAADRLLLPVAPDAQGFSNYQPSDVHNWDERTGQPIAGPAYQTPPTAQQQPLQNKPWREYNP